TKESSKEIPSFYKQNDEFKATFRKIEKLLLQKGRTQRIVVFVDDLDRCEPENVLNLITALKLFFTYGENTIFFCGLDQEAVTKAVKTKYQDVVKADEYLEKVFDITFNMPKIFSLDKFLGNYFPGDFSAEHTDREIIGGFFQAINFTNPRHIKKMLNKYEILRSYKKNSQMPTEISSLIPNILLDHNSGNVFETVFCLYFMILHEYYPDEFSDIENYDAKFASYGSIYIDTIRGEGNSIISVKSNDSVRSNLMIRNIGELSLSLMFDAWESNDRRRFVRFLMLFSNSRPQEFRILEDVSPEKYFDLFTDKGVLTLFCGFLITYQDQIIKANYSDYIFWNYFTMAKYLL
ncbi:MAG: hypothetical protein EOO20_22910, partial [Chryseobacterium sp.]